MKKLTRYSAIIGAVAAGTLIITSSPADEAKKPTAEAKAAAEKPADKTRQLFDDKVVGKAKGCEVKQSEVEDALLLFKANAAARGVPVPKDQKEIENKLIERLLVVKILQSKASEQEKAKAREEAVKAIEDTKKRFPSEEMFAQQLKASGMSLKEFETRMVEQNICEGVLERELKDKVKVGDAELKKFYEENPQRFEMPERVRASHILLMTQDGGKSIDEAAKKKKLEQAKELKARAEKGEDFAKLAKEFSEDPGSKDRGGEYTFPRGQMVPEFEKAAFSMNTNQVSDVVETQYGYHIIKLLEKLPAKKVELAEVSDKLKQDLQQQEFAKQVPEYIEQLKKEYNAQIGSDAVKSAN